MTVVVLPSLSTTAQTLITRAMRLAGVIGKGETPDADESIDGLAALNAMLESWSTERLFVYCMTEELLTLVAGTSRYSMGSGGDLNTTRPTRIEDQTFLRFTGSLDIPISLIDDRTYQMIVAKTVQSNVPMYLFADMQNQLVYLNFYPTPSVAYVVHIFSWKQNQQFSSLTTQLALPQGHARALAYSLAEEFGPEFGVQLHPQVQAIAAKARANLKRINAPSPVMSVEVAYMNARRVAGNIYTG